MSDSATNDEALDFDPDELRRKYQVERDKRIRPEGSEQYTEVAGDFSQYIDDPYIDVTRKREPLNDEIDVAIIGGGFVGLEVAAVTRKLGKDVTVYEAEERLMGRVVSAMLSEFYSDLHRKNGVSLHMGDRIDRVKVCDNTLEIYANKQHSLDCDIIVAGIGAIANDEIALEAGLNCDRGIIVDNRCLTSDPDVVAAGDCTVHYNQFAGKSVRLESVQNAVDQAKVAASTMLGGEAVYDQVPWFWSDQYDAKLQIAGINAGYDKYLTAGRPEDNKFSIFYFKDDSLIGADSINDPSSHMAVRKIMTTKIASMVQIRENLDDLRSFAKQ